MLRQGFHIGLQALDEALVLGDLLREIFQKIVLHLELLALVGRLHNFELGHVHIQLHALFDTGVPGAQGLDLRIGQRRLVHILTGPGRGFAGHNLGNKFLLILHRLPEVGIKCAFCDIAVHMYALVVIAPAFNAAFALCQVTGPPGTVQIMEGNELVLHVCASAHFESASNQDAHLTGADLGKQLLLLHIGFRLMDKGYLFGAHPTGNELLPDVLIDGEGLFRFQGDSVLQHVEGGVVQLIPGPLHRPLGGGGFGCGK